jgi:hypothetical protein
MARSVATIYNTAVTQYVANAAAAGITINPAAWSMYNYQSLIFWTMAFCQSLLEQIQDSFTTDVQGIVAIASPQTALWIQNFVLNVFQYNSATPQIIQFNTISFAPYYSAVNTSYRIVTQCVVVPGTFGTTTVQAAKTVGGAYVALASAELYALQSTLNAVTVPGITINAVSKNADEIFIDGTVTYNGQYAGVIAVTNGTVVQAIQAYLSSIPASGVAGVGSVVGVMKLTDLIAAVRAVPGVIDFELNNVNARAATTPFVTGSYNMVSSGRWLMNEWQSGSLGAGYMVTETTTGYDINTSLQPNYTAI